MLIPLYLFTFNCAKLKIKSADFITHIHETLPDEPPHLFVFGFQEICSILDGTKPSAVLKHLIDINRVVLDALKSKYAASHDGEISDYSFTTVGINHIGAIGIIAVTPFPLKFRDTKFASASCGSARSLLKGGVGLRVKYKSPNLEDVELTFAAAHLSAYEGEFYYQRRLQNIQTLMRAMDFGDGYSFLKPKCHSFFLGDLNFRTTTSIEENAATVQELVDLQDQNNEDGGEIEKLVLKHDELTRGRQNGELFLGFSEGCIKFRPTYKYHVNTAIYNSKRCPLWCDRILYQATYKTDISPTVHTYNSLPTYMSSDHRPVYLHLTVPHTPPESIISHSGYLIILPTVRPHSHSAQTIDFPDSSDSMSGPTLIYLKCTALDKINQLLARRVSDYVIGSGLWLGCTSNGRLSILGTVLLLWLIYTVQH